MKIFDEQYIFRTVETPVHRRRKSSVRFSAEHEVNEIESREDFSPSEIKATWYNHADYNSFKREALVTLSLNRSGRLEEQSKEYTMRGLEARTREGSAKRKQMRDVILCQVLSEQERQRQLCFEDPHLIAYACRGVSSASLFVAKDRAQLDEADVQLDTPAEPIVAQPILRSGELCHLSVANMNTSESDNLFLGLALNLTSDTPPMMTVPSTSWVAAKA